MLKRSHIVLWLKDRENLFFLVLVAVCIIPIWSCEYFPSQGGPCHLDMAQAVYDYNNAEYPIFRTFYEVAVRAAGSNMLADILLVMLLNIFSPLVAEKIMLSLYVILFPVSVRYALGGINSKSRFLSILSFPFIYNYSLHIGLYNFIYGIPLVFFIIGYWLRHEMNFSITDGAILFALSCLVFMAHPLPAALAVAALGIMVFWRFIYDVSQRADVPGAGRRLAGRVVILLVCSLPAMAGIVTILFLHGKSAADPNLSVSAILNSLRYPVSLISYAQTEVFYAGYLFLLFAAVALYEAFVRIKNQAVMPGDAFLFLTIIYLAAYCSTASYYLFGKAYTTDFGYTFMHFNIFIFLTMVLWFGTSSYSPTIKRIIQYCAIAFIVIMIMTRVYQYGRISIYLNNYVSSSAHIAKNSTVLPLIFVNSGHLQTGSTKIPKVSPLLHACGYVTGKVKIAQLGNYQAATPFFIIAYRPELNPHRYFGDIVGNPANADIRHYTETTGERVDYVLMWMAPEENSRRRRGPLFEQLQSDYDLIYVSPGSCVSLYRRKDFRNLSE